jgi:hypothetical protein
VTALAGAVLAFGAAAPAAFATLPPPEPGRTGDTAPVVIHTVIVGGMPDGKIILIAAAAAALAAVAAARVQGVVATLRPKGVFVCVLDCLVLSSVSFGQRSVLGCRGGRRLPRWACR